MENHKGGGREGGENDSKHICPQFVCSYNTKPQAWPCTNLSPLGKAACGNVSRPWVFNARTRGNSLSPRSDNNVRQGHTNISGGGMSKQVAQACESPWTASGAVRWSKGNHQFSCKVNGVCFFPSFSHLSVSLLKKKCHNNRSILH